MERQAPNLITTLPGPRAQAYLGKNKESVSPSLPHAYPLVIKQAHGCVVEDLAKGFLPPGDEILEAQAQDLRPGGDRSVAQIEANKAKWGLSD